jgi:hypothetical protein
VKTIVLMLPKRLAILEATNMEPAAMMEVVKNREPRRPSSKPNFQWKKYVTHDLCHVTSCRIQCRMGEQLHGSEARCKCI